MKRFGLACLVLLVSATLLAGEPKSSDADELARMDARITAIDRRHWSFQPIRSPSVPEVKDPSWCLNPIDHFVLAKLEAKGWKPSPPAEPRSLLRRTYLNLIGVPPTLEEQEAFVKAPSADSLDREVNRLLAHPAYGERWGRHWLDLVRYAETNGYERDATKPFAWRYRDYVIQAFNDDKPFDRFLLEQLAGDELADASTETLIATGFYRLGPWDDEPADPKEDRFDQLDDMVAATSQVFLGLTLSCARCHHHKFEALTMHDYYRMVAVFNTLQRPQNGRTELHLPAGSRSQVEALVRRERQVAGLRTAAVAQRIASTGLPFNSASAFVAVEERIQHLRQETPDLPRGYFLHEPAAQPPLTQILHRGQASRPGAQVQPGMPTVLAASQPSFLSHTAHTSQRRLTLAQWMARPENPLTARVIVNRVWQFHFGEGLVRTASDFGANGEKPTHPELLDWLAHWFVSEGWSIKKLHRLILSSNTYRMSKRSVAEYAAVDPESRLLWRMPYRRLEVEAIRDSMLAVSGRLNPKMGGPSMYPFVPKEALEGHSDPDKIWPAFEEKEASRRTVYAFIKRSMVVPMLEVLDHCDTTRSSAKRSVTSVAPQALTLMNGDFVNRQARHLADRLAREVGNDAEKQIERAYRLTLCRPSTATEQQVMVEFLRRETEGQIKESSAQGKPIERKEAEQRALVQMCRVMFNLNEFVYPD